MRERERMREGEGGVYERTGGGVEVEPKRERRRESWAGSSRISKKHSKLKRDMRRERERNRGGERLGG